MQLYVFHFLLIHFQEMSGLGLGGYGSSDEEDEAVPAPPQVKQVALGLLLTKERG